MNTSPPAPRDQLLQELERLKQMLDEEAGEAAAEVAMDAIPVLEDVVAELPPGDLPRESVFRHDEDLLDTPPPRYPWLPPQPVAISQEIRSWQEDLGQLDSLLAPAGDTATPAHVPAAEESAIPVLPISHAVELPAEAHWREPSDTAPADIEAAQAAPGPAAETPYTPVAEAPAREREEGRTAAPSEEALELQLRMGAELLVQSLLREHLPALESALRQRLQEELGELIEQLARQRSGGELPPAP